MARRGPHDTVVTIPTTHTACTCSLTPDTDATWFEDFVLGLVADVRERGRVLRRRSATRAMAHRFVARRMTRE